MRFGGAYAMGRYYWCRNAGLFLVIAVACALGAYPIRLLGQVPAVVVVVRDAETGRPVAGVRVALDQHVVGDTTAGDGTVRIGVASPGEHELLLRAVGYRPDSQAVMVKRDSTTRMEVELQPVRALLPRVRAIGTPVDPRLAGFMTRRGKGGGFFFTRGEIDSSHTRTLDLLLRSHSPANLVAGPAGAIYLASHSAQMGFSRTPCWTQIFQDGVLIYHYDAWADPEHNPPPDLSGFLNSQFEAVEFYPNPATTPVQFRGATPSCGTLVLWSRMH